jgi:GLPGLI family protein
MKYLYLIIFLNYLTIFSQNKVRITYSVIPTGGSLEKNQEVVKSKVASSFVGVDDALSRLTFILIVKDLKSYFYLESMLDFNEKPARIARAFAGNTEFFKDEQQKTIIKKVDFSNEIFYVKLDSVPQWELRNEQKIINGYTCFKATREKLLRLKQRNQVHIVQAWYCPAIPVRNGPKEFGDLPGLILELQDDKITYLATKIELDGNLKLMIKEVNQKLILEDDFYKIMKEKFANSSSVLN